MNVRTFRKVISAFMVVMLALTMLPSMLREVQASGTYGQVTGDNPIIKGDFNFTNAVNTSGSAGVFVDTGITVDQSKGALTTDGTTIKLANGFKYKDTSYDVYIKVTPDINLDKTLWTCNYNSALYLSLSPNTDAGAMSKFTYEIWLMNGGTRVTNINMVAGSCYTASSEGARPYSDNGTIYTTIPSSNIIWNSEYSAYSPTSSNYDNSSIYMLGHGTSSESSIKGGYVRTEGNGGCEIVWGYLTEITFRNEDGAHAGALGNTAQNINANTTISAPDTNPEKGYYFSHWTIEDADGNPMAVNTQGNGTIYAGKELTTAELKTVIADKEFTVVAHYKSYTAETTSTDTNDSADEDKLIVKKGDSEIATVTINAEDMVYNGEAYTSDKNVSISSLTDPQIEELIQAGYITDKDDLATAKVTYYVANDGDSTPTTKTTTDNSGAADEGGLPVKVGKYYAVLSFGDSGKQIYSAFNITPNPYNTVKADNYEGVYDGKAHTITVTVPKDAKVTYSTTKDGTYRTAAPMYTEVTDGANIVYYKVVFADGMETTGYATVTITAAKDDKTDDDKTDDNKTDDTTPDKTDDNKTDDTTPDKTDDNKTDDTTPDDTNSSTPSTDTAGNAQQTDNGQAQSESAVKTGDSTSPCIIFIICVLALLGAAGMMTYRYKSQL